MKVMDSEVKAMVMLAKAGSNPNVINLLEIIDDEAGFEDKLILVMEFCPGGQLLTWSPESHQFIPNRSNQRVDATGHITESTIRRAIREVGQGLQFCHEQGVIHRDVKPQNILFNDAHEAKIIDFGVSKVMDSPDGSDICKQTEGTYHFMAPEACDPDVDEFSGKASDVWALGVTLYILLFNKCPFWGQTDY